MLLVWSVSFLLLAGVSHQCHVFWQHVPHHLQKIQQVLWPPGNPASLAMCGLCLSWKPWFLHCSWMSVCSVFSRATVSHLLLADRVCIFMFLGVVSACSSLLTFAFYPCVALKTSGSWQVSYFMAEAKEIPWKWVLCKAETLVESLVFIFFGVWFYLRQLVLEWNVENPSCFPDRLLWERFFPAPWTPILYVYRTKGHKKALKRCREENYWRRGGSFSFWKIPLTVWSGRELSPLDVIGPSVKWDVIIITGKLRWSQVDVRSVVLKLQRGS